MSRSLLQIGEVQRLLLTAGGARAGGVGRSEGAAGTEAAAAAEPEEQPQKQQQLRRRTWASTTSGRPLRPMDVRGAHPHREHRRRDSTQCHVRVCRRGGGGVRQQQQQQQVVSEVEEGVESPLAEKERPLPLRSLQMRFRSRSGAAGGERRVDRSECGEA